MSSIDPEAVYEAVRQLPPGAVITYAELAERVGQPRSSARAIGNVLRGRPDREAWLTTPAGEIDVPWWRVVRSDGTLRSDEDDATDERRRGLDWAKTQLAREGVAFTNDGRVASLAGPRQHGGSGGRGRAQRNVEPEPCWRHDTVQYSCRDCAPSR